jgi:hypothetical protein
MPTDERSSGQSNPPRGDARIGRTGGHIARHVGKGGAQPASLSRPPGYRGTRNPAEQKK